MGDAGRTKDETKDETKDKASGSITCPNGNHGNCVATVVCTSYQVRRTLYLPFAVSHSHVPHSHNPHSHIPYSLLPTRYSLLPALRTPMSLFEAAEAENRRAAQPLAARMRPRSLSEFVGQEHFLGEGKLLRRLLSADRLGSVIFYGPPGLGKTTLARLLAQRKQQSSSASSARSPAA